MIQSNEKTKSGHLTLLAFIIVFWFSKLEFEAVYLQCNNTKLYGKMIKSGISPLCGQFTCEDWIPMNYAGIIVLLAKWKKVIPTPGFTKSVNKMQTSISLGIYKRTEYVLAIDFTQAAFHPLFINVRKKKNKITMKGTISHIPHFQECKLCVSLIELNAFL